MQGDSVIAVPHRSRDQYGVRAMCITPILIQLCYSALHANSKSHSPWLRSYDARLAYMRHPVRGNSRAEGTTSNIGLAGERLGIMPRIVYQIPCNTGILGDCPISSLKHARTSRHTDKR